MPSLMPKSWRRTRTLVALLPALALLLSACGSSGGGSSANAKGTIPQDFDFAGAHFVVSSKEFTENIILGKITVRALRAAGADVQDKTNLQGSTVVREALLERTRSTCIGTTREPDGRST